MASSSGKAKSTLQFLGRGEGRAGRKGERERPKRKEGEPLPPLIFVCAFRTQVYAELTENMKLPCCCCCGCCRALLVLPRCGPRDLNKTADVSSQTKRRKKDCSLVGRGEGGRVGGRRGALILLHCIWNSRRRRKQEQQCMHEKTGQCIRDVTKQRWVAGEIV